MEVLSLKVSAQREWAVVPRVALRAAGAVAGLTAEALEELCMACDEAGETLRSQPFCASALCVKLLREGSELVLSLSAEFSEGKQDFSAPDEDMVEAVLLTCMASVALSKEKGLITGIHMTTPVIP